MWSNMSALHLRVFGLTAVGLGMLIGLKYNRGINAPASTGRWLLIAAASAQAAHRSAADPGGGSRAA
jgi:hypothetical protein